LASQKIAYKHVILFLLDMEEPLVESYLQKTVTEKILLYGFNKNKITFSIIDCTVFTQRFGGN